MSELTYIKGKEECLENSISNMQSILQKLDFQINDKAHLNPVPYIHSLHIFDEHCPGLFTNGKGASEKATLASALGEFLERLSTNYFFSDYWLMEQEDEWLYYPQEKHFNETDWRLCLTPGLWKFYDEQHELDWSDLLSFNDHSDFIRAIPMSEESSGETVYFPMNLLSNLYASNGLSAGNTALEAQVQGLSEVFERWVKNTILQENICLPEVPQSVLQQYPNVCSAIEALKAEGIEVSVRDASLGGRFPVINVTLFEQQYGRCFASFGAHPMFEVALERTLTESLQGRKLGELDGFQVPIFDEELVASAENLENHFIDSSGWIHARFISHQYDHEFTQWDFSGDTRQQWDALCQTVHELGYEVYTANYNQFGFETCRIVVPGMSEVYPVDELLHSNQSQGRHLRQMLLELPKKQNYMQLVDWLDEAGYSDHQGVISIIGLMPDPGSFWGHVNVIQLKFWCCLAAEEWQEALDLGRDIGYFVSPDSPWAKVYQSLNYGLEAVLENEILLEGMQLLFGAELTEKALANLQGEELFWGAESGREIFSKSKRHQAMLRIYRNLKPYKESSL
ncbi:30S ribosomal protein S12 methylthiotransferase accessory factor YcaO [Thiomicrorhabdus heinhorstiae]|uniref:YcaO-like family protein n=1 Tax=Thiomicrorhabdus heinhorstiae TaxID=2748010 RepID=A0ABS0BV33_9GAMM|nr:30S ribosomal protein S12 methylthiotransferase accessory factor YcaO [Thiomicrorhabdus heinhorstiae]MBF6056834.1 YcaO-like family protein [Thiomicrorhabdus heinhorstiae]